MSINKGKPSGKYAESKTSPGRKGNYQRSGWPENAPTQRVETGRKQQQGLQRSPTKRNVPGLGRGRNRKAGPA
jgi:hypothetical protein